MSIFPGFKAYFLTFIFAFSLSGCGGSQPPAEKSAPPAAAVPAARTEAPELVSIPVIQYSEAERTLIKGVETDDSALVLHAFSEGAAPDLMVAADVAPGAKVPLFSIALRKCTGETIREFLDSKVDLSKIWTIQYSDSEINYTYLDVVMPLTGVEIFREKPTDLADWLMGAGADPNQIYTEDGGTILHKAVKHGLIDFVSLLREYEADPSIRNRKDQSVYDLSNRIYLTEGPFVEIRNILEQP